MALDWKKEISVGDILAIFGKGKKGAKGSSGGYPTKTTMNLYQGDQTTTDIRKVGITAVFLTIFIALFVKFGLRNLLDQVSQKEGELAAQKQIAMSLTQSSEEYEDIKALYDAYQARLGSAAVDIIAVLDMVEDTVMTKAEVTSIVVSDGTLTLTLYNVPLDTVGDLAKSIEGQELVSAVHVSTATTQNADAQNTVSTLVVTLVGTQTEEE